MRWSGMQYSGRLPQLFVWCGADVKEEEFKSDIHTEESMDNLILFGNAIKHAYDAS